MATLSITIPNAKVAEVLAACTLVVARNAGETDAAYAERAIRSGFFRPMLETYRRRQAQLAADAGVVVPTDAELGG